MNRWQNNSSWSFLSLLLLGLASLATLRFIEAGTGSSISGTIPVSAFPNGGATHQNDLPNGSSVQLDSSVGLALVEGAAGSALVVMNTGFQSVKEVVIQQTSTPSQISFRRGDANGDGTFDIGDAIQILAYLFLSGEMNCMDAGDGNDDGQLNIADGLFVLEALFNNTALPPDPGPQSCDTDPSADALSCDLYTGC